MKHVTVSWERQDERFVARGSHQGHDVVINAPHEGTGQTGFSASELLLAGIGACSAWDVVEVMRKKRQPLGTLEVSVTGEQEADAPWPYRRIEIVYRAGGAGLSRTALEHAAQLSAEKYCSVIATVRGVATVETRVELDETATADGAAVGADGAPGEPAIRVRTGARTEE
jgi:putative redox protein